MATIIVLDSGPLGLACNNPDRPEVMRMLTWRINAVAKGALLVIPEIADYEVRRGLIQAKLDQSVNRLDELCQELTYLPINTKAMKLAARIWADLRSQGRQTADDMRLDADVILAAQALGSKGQRDTLTVATENVRHFSAMSLDSRPWGVISL